MVQEHSGNVINEAFRVVRTNLEFVLGREGRCKTIMFTSANAGSGKTFISMNLAKSFAIKDKRVLVIDLDLRKASLSSFVESPTVGISNYLSERTDDIDSIIVKGKVCPNLDVVPVGTMPPNPTELLFNDRLEQFITQMQAKYDYVFIDCPPIDIVADSATKLLESYTHIPSRKATIRTFRTVATELQKTGVLKKKLNIEKFITSHFANFASKGIHVPDGYKYDKDTGTFTETTEEPKTLAKNIVEN